MDYKAEFTKFVEENSLEEARIILDKLKIHAMDDPFYYANMGWVLNHMERYEEAEIYLKKGMHYFSDDAWMCSQLGFCFNRQGRIQEGLSMLQSALDMGYDEPWIHGELGWCYKELNQYESAIHYFENALMDDAANVWTLSQAAGTYALLGNDEMAEEYFLKSYKIEPDVDSAYDLINFYKSHKEYEKELPYLFDISDDEWNTWKAYEIGNVYLHLDQYEDAYTYLKQALTLGRDDTGIRNELGDCCDALKYIEEANEHYTAALTYYEKALKNETERYWIYQEMIWIAHKQRDYVKKLRYLLDAEKERKDDVWLMYHFARTYTELAEYDKAEAACLFCIDKGENRKEMLDLYAWNLSRNHKEDQALEILETRIADFGGDEWVYGEIGWDYAQKKNYEKARSYFFKAYEFDIHSFVHISMIGWCYLREDNIKEAKSYMKKALAMGRNDGWVHVTMAEIYENEENFALAIDEYRKAKELQYEVEWVKKEIRRLRKLQKEKKVMV